MKESRSDSSIPSQRRSVSVSHEHSLSEPVISQEKTQVVEGSVGKQDPENDSSCSSSSSEEWIAGNRKLIDEARDNEGAFRELIRKLQAENMVFIYDEICDNCWLNRHLYDTCHDGVKFYGGVCEHQTCGF